MSCTPFDVHDRNSYYFGSMSRKEATDILMNERECGVFLVRDSSTIIGDFVLSVKEVCCLLIISVTNFIAMSVQNSSHFNKSVIPSPQGIESSRLQILPTFFGRVPVPGRFDPIFSTR